MTAAPAGGYCEPMRQTTGFARLPDGGRIAFAVVGSGPAVVIPAWWVSNVVEDWHFEPLRRFVEGLAAGRMVVRDDRPGAGPSPRAGALSPRALPRGGRRASIASCSTAATPRGTRLAHRKRGPAWLTSCARI